MCKQNLGLLFCANVQTENLGFVLSASVQTENLGHVFCVCVQTENFSFVLRASVQTENLGFVFCANVQTENLCADNVLNEVTFSVVFSNNSVASHCCAFELLSRIPLVLNRILVLQYFFLACLAGSPAVFLSSSVGSCFILYLFSSILLLCFFPFYLDPAFLLLTCPIGSCCDHYLLIQWDPTVLVSGILPAVVFGIPSRIDCVVVCVRYPVVLSCCVLNTH